MKNLLRAVLCAPVFLLLATQAHATKWASATLHTKQSIDQVFRRTTILADGTKWGFRTTSAIESSSLHDGTIWVALMAGGEKWGCVYISMKPDGAGTSIEAVVSLRSEAWHSPSTFAAHLGKELKKTFPDIEFEVKNNFLPPDFAFGVRQMSIPTEAPDAATVQALRPLIDVPQSTTLSVTQSVVVEAPPPIASSQLYGGNQQQEMGQAMQNLGTTLMGIGAEMEVNLAAEMREHNQTMTKDAIRRFLSDAQPSVRIFLATNNSQAVVEFGTTAAAVNEARDKAYSMLDTAIQRGAFNQTTNEYMLSFEKEMGDHLYSLGTDPHQTTENLHEALDSWYANGKDWTKIPPEIWNRLPERDKGRFKDGIDPEIGAKQ